jgi:hypothetical protein
MAQTDMVTSRGETASIQNCAQRAQLA